MLKKCPVEITFVTDPPPFVSWQLNVSFCYDIYLFFQAKQFLFISALLRLQGACNGNEHMLIV